MRQDRWSAVCSPRNCRGGGSSGSMSRSRSSRSRWQFARSPNHETRMHHVASTSLAWHCSTAGIGAFTLAFDRGPSWGWVTVATAGLGVAAAVVLTAFVYVERRTANPLVDLASCATRRFTVLVIAGTVANIAYAVVIFGSTLNLQQGRGLDPLVAGVVFIGPSAGAALAGPLSGRLAARSQPVVIMGGACVAAGFAVGLLAAASSWPFYIAALTASRIHPGFDYAFTTVATQSVVRRRASRRSRRHHPHLACHTRGCRCAVSASSLEVLQEDGMSIGSRRSTEFCSSSPPDCWHPDQPSSRRDETLRKGRRSDVRSASASHPSALILTLAGCSSPEEEAPVVPSSAVPHVYTRPSTRARGRSGRCRRYRSASGVPDDRGRQLDPRARFQVGDRDVSPHRRSVGGRDRRGDQNNLYVTIPAPTTSCRLSTSTDGSHDRNRAGRRCARGRGGESGASRVVRRQRRRRDCVVVDTETRAITATVKVGDEPAKMGVDPESHRIYVANSSTGGVTVIDGDSLAVITTIPDDKSPRDAAGRPSADQISLRPQLPRQLAFRDRPQRRRDHRNHRGGQVNRGRNRRLQRWSCLCHELRRRHGLRDRHQESESDRDHRRLEMAPSSSPSIRRLTSPGS